MGIPNFSMENPYQNEVLYQLGTLQALAQTHNDKLDDLKGEFKAHVAEDQSRLSKLENASKYQWGFAGGIGFAMTVVAEFFSKVVFHHG